MILDSYPLPTPVIGTIESQLRGEIPLRFPLESTPIRLIYARMTQLSSFATTRYLFNIEEYFGTPLDKAGPMLILSAELRDSYTQTVPDRRRTYENQTTF